MQRCSQAAWSMSAPAPRSSGPLRKLLNMTAPAEGCDSRSTTSESRCTTGPAGAAGGVASRSFGGGGGGGEAGGAEGASAGA
jgi:hypothetical protein